jgi:hypothetical protein
VIIDGFAVISAGVSFAVMSDGYGFAVMGYD